MFQKYASQIRAGFIACITLIIAIALCIWGVQQASRVREIETRGVVTIGALEDVDVERYKHVPIGYSFTVRALGISKKVDVSRSLFYRYVSDDRFVANASIELLYLPENQADMIPRQMMGARFYWGGGPFLKFVYAIPIFGVSALIFWAISLSLRMPGNRRRVQRQE